MKIQCLEKFISLSYAQKRTMENAKNGYFGIIIF